jgi:hypothetical protein
MSDPNGWVLNPPTKIVKIHSLTQQAQLNGQTAIVVGYLEDSRRYVVVLTSSPQQRQVSLRAENLSSCGWYDSAKAQYEMVTQNPQVRQQVITMWNDQVRPRLPPPIRQSSPQTLAVGIGVVLVVSMYLLGLSRTMLWISFAIMAAIVVGPILGGSPRDVATRLVPRTQHLLRQSGVPLIATRVAGNSHATLALIVAVVAVFVSGMIPPSSRSSASSPPMIPPHTTVSPGPQHDREHYYYKLGFDDAVSKHPFGHSLALESKKMAPTERKALDETTLDLSTNSEFADDRSRHDPPSYYGSPPPPVARPPRWGRLGVGNVLSMGFTLNTLYGLGLGGGAGSSSWTFSTFRQNLSQMPPWRMGLLGLSVYRVASIFL